MNNNSKEILEIIKEYKSKSNVDLRKAMDYINEDFELTKKNLIQLTHHLDKLETTYNKLLSEYKTRNGTK
jgi:hypothetical protein